jgi:putative nucleotidyltransferase with HDIG domain
MILLGSSKVLQLVMSVHSNSLLTSEQQGYGLEPGVLWRHSVAVALASAMFSSRLGLPNGNLAFTAGLLHDIGKVVLNEHVAEEFAEIVRRVTEDGMSFPEAESSVLGFSHDEVGALVVEQWRLPDTMVKCARFHHQPGRLDPPDAIVDTVYLADCVCLLMGIGVGEDGLCYRAEEAVMERNGLREQDLEVIGAQMLTELQKVERLFAEIPDMGRHRVPAKSQEPCDVQ